MNKVDTRVLSFLVLESCPKTLAFRVESLYLYDPRSLLSVLLPIKKDGHFDP